MPKVYVKCKYCGVKIDRDTAYKLKDKQYFCNEDHAKLFSGTDTFYKERLLEKLCSLYDNPNYVRLKAQVETAFKDGMKYSGLELTLDYYLNVLEQPYQTQYGIGQFTQYYSQAKDFYIHKNNIKNKLKTACFEDDIRYVKIRKTANCSEKHYEDIENL